MAKFNNRMGAVGIQRAVGALWEGAKMGAAALGPAAAIAVAAKAAQGGNEGNEHSEDEGGE